MAEERKRRAAALASNELGHLTGSSRNAAISFDDDVLLEAGDELRVWTSKA